MPARLRSESIRPFFLLNSREPITKDIQTLIKQRVSGNNFDVNRPLPDGVVEQLIDLAARAPSAFNLQNWKFIAVRSPQAKARLRTLQPAVDAGIVPPSLRQTWGGVANEALHA